MDAILRASLTYLFLLVVVRAAGRRTLAQATTFDLVLLLIISEAAQNAMIGQDTSMTKGFLAITTLILMDVALAAAKCRWPRFDRAMEGLPLVIVEDGRPIADRMARARIDEDDILEAARTARGIGRMDQIQFAVLERNGGISILPKPDAKP